MSKDGNGYKLISFRGVWCVYWREELDDGKTRPKRASLRTRHRAEAEERFKDFLKQAAGAPENIGQLFERYLEEKKGTAGYETARYNWKALQPTFQYLRHDQVDRAACRKHTDRRREFGIGDNTILRELQMLRAAIRWFYPGTSAVFELPSKPDPSDRYLTRAEFEKLLGSTVGPHVRLFIILALSTAARATALLELTWDRVDLDRKIIRLRKGGESRNKGRATVPITDFALQALLTAKEGAISEYVIEFAGGPVKSVKTGVAAAAARAGLEDVSPHVLRHTAAVWLAEAGVPMSEIAQYLGHSDTRTTERIYARFSPDYLRGAAKALDLSPALPLPHQNASTGRKSAKA